MKKLLLIIIFINLLLPLSAQNPSSKTGGICFRVDDHQGAVRWRDWNRVFNRRGLKFSLAINASRLFNDTAAVNALKEIVASGHELMDHTPDHHMGFFTVRTISDTSAYSGHPAVDHINGTKVCLKLAPPVTNSFTGEGLVNLIGNRLISVNNGEFRTLNGNPYYALVYLPSKNITAVYTSIQNRISTDPDTLVLQTYWQETWKNDTAFQISYERLTTSDVKSSAAANLLLAQRSIQLFNGFGLPSPKTWIQPGGSFALLNRQEVKTFATQVGYTAGAVNIQSSQKCYNEVDSFADRRFALQGPDFYEESNNFQGLANIISDRSARHYQSFGLSHFNNVQGGWNVFLDKVDSVLVWSLNNGIPIRTYERWASILFDSVPAAGANIMPSLNRDLNNNSLPDGYTIALANFEGTDGVTSSGNKCISSSSNNTSMASITNLGGLEKGINLFKMFTKGQPGDSIRMVMSFPDVSLPSQIIMFGAGTSDWTPQLRTVNIPVNASRVNISFVLIKRNNPGIVKMSGLEMRKSSIPSIRKSYYQQKRVMENFQSIPLNNWVSDAYYAYNDLSFSLIPNPNFTYSFNAINNVLDVQTSRKFFVGKDSIKIAVSNPDGLSDTAWFVFESKAIEINEGDTVASTITFPNGSIAYESKPYDSSFIYSAGNFFAQPKQSGTYLFHWTEQFIAKTDSFFIKVNRLNAVDTNIVIDSLPIDSNIVNPVLGGQADFKNKKGGVCFRFDDHQLPSNWRAINNLFNSYGLKFTLGLNASRLIGDTAAINAMKEIAAAGHEIADHTPDHTTAFFNVYSLSDTINFSSLPGVDHINGKRVCLKVDSVITSTYSNEGLLNINGSTVISQSNGEFRNMNGSIYYSNLFFPTLNRVYVYTNLRNLNQNDPDTCTIQTIWGESVNLGVLNGLAHHRLTQTDIKMSREALALLIGRSASLFNQLGLPPAKTFLLPSGNYAMFSRAEMKSQISLLGGFTGGGVYASPSFKCYNEFDSNEDKRFGMNAPDFREETNTAESIKGIIADNSAKHHSSFGLSQFSSLLGGMNGYLSRIDTLLKWCVQNNISVLPYRDWSAI
ncbi:MAG: polysaccharide deacetylase family protein [Bacteroidia bacterium]